MRFRTHETVISWGNIEDQIASLLHAVKVPESRDILKIKFIGEIGGFMDREAPVKLSYVTKEGVDIIKF